MLFKISLLLFAATVADNAILEFASRPQIGNKKYESVSDIPGILTQQKCLEYMEMGLKRNIDSGCNENRILDGEQSQISDYPHMGALGWKLRNSLWVFLCGSSLISSKFLVTAGHCMKLGYTSSLDVESKYPKVVRLGATNIREPETKDSVTIKIKQIIPHPYYKSPNKYYDIALVELKKPVEFSNFIHPGCLSVHDIDIKKQYTVTGWGQTEADSASIDSLSPVLLSAKLDVIDDTKCKSLVEMEQMTNRLWKYLGNHQICAGMLDGSTDTCYGDSGGPLQTSLINTENFKMHTIVGITSFGKGCAIKGRPSIFTKVTNFLDWIEEIVWRNENDSTYIWN